MLLFLTIAVLVLPVIMLLAYAGCVGEDPKLVQAKEEAEKKVAEAAKEKEDKKYDKKIIVEPNLVSWWRLDEGQPETGDVKAFDSAPVAPLHGEYRNLQGVQRGEKGAVIVDKNAAVQFLGTVGYIDVAFDALLNPPLSFSVELWLRPEAQPATTPPQGLVGSYEPGAAGTVGKGFALQVVHVPKLAVRALVGNGAVTTTLDADLGDGLQFGGWRHVVMSYDGAGKTLSLYVNADDGKADAILPTAALPAPVLYEANQSMPLRIGAGILPAPAPATPGMHFQGRLDEVALYRTALAGPSVREHFLAATA